MLMIISTIVFIVIPGLSYFISISVIDFDEVNKESTKQHQNHQAPTHITGRGDL